MKIEELRVGQSFRVDGNEYTKLNDTNLCILDTYTEIDCLFDFHDSDYDKSLLRCYINNCFCELMNIDKSMLEPVYKSDYLALLSEQSFENYESFISTGYFGEWWLRWGFNAYCNSAPVVTPCGFVTCVCVDNICSVRPVLIFKKSVEVELI